jgi:predicted AAA+ superfamily ATPase
MFPMTFLEFIEALGEDLLVKYLQEWSDSELSDSTHAKAWELLKIYMIVGGLPEAILNYIEYRQEGDFIALEKVRLIQETLTKTYLSDMAKHSGKENALHLERVWSSVPIQLGREQDGSAAKYKFKGVLPHVTNYSRLASSLDWLNAAGLLIKVPIVNSAQLPLKAYTEENRFKLFMFDIGLLGSLAGISPKTIFNYDYGTYKGFFAENLVAMELSTLLASRDKLHCWREGESEIEFLQEIDDKLIPIEVKSGFNTKSRSLAVYAGKYKPERRVIISAQNYSRNSKINLVKLPLYLVSKVMNQSLEAVSCN